MRNDRILLIRTGGSIDALPYDLSIIPPDITPLLGPDSLITRTIQKMPNSQNVDMYDWGIREKEFVKDSKHFTDQNLEQLADIIMNDEHKYFVLTHGIDRVKSNALHLNKLLEGTGKTVVLVGAMVPLSVRPETSDGIELLRFTIDNITDSDQKPGVYIAAYDAHTKRARFFDPDKASRDLYASRDVDNQGRNQRLIFRE